MQDAYRGALFQDHNFKFSGFDGLKLEKLMTCENPTLKNVVLVFIKVENKECVKFNLDRFLQRIL